MNLKETDKINEEIRKFMNYETNIPDQSNDKKIPLAYSKSTRNNNFEKLLSVLNEIKMILSESKYSFDYDKLNNKKTSGINNDKKEEERISIMNTSLVNLIKSIIEERREKEEELKQYFIRIKELEKENDSVRNEILKNNDEFKYEKQVMNELKRIVKDQKETIKGYKDKINDEKNENERLKTVNNEVELINENFNIKCSQLKEQNTLFNTYLKSKDQELNKFKILLGEIKEENKSLQAQIQRILEIRSKLESKISDQDKTIVILNEELLNSIKSDKKEDYTYYKKMYEAVSKQNEYLNEQLNKLISPENVKIIEKENKNKIIPINKTKKSTNFINKNQEKIYHDIESNKNIKMNTNIKNNYDFLKEMDNKESKNKIDEEKNATESTDKTFNFKSDDLTIPAVDNDLKVQSDIKSRKYVKTKKYKKKVEAFKKKLNEMENEKIQRMNEIKEREQKIGELADEIILLRKDTQKSNEEKRSINENLLIKIEKLMDDNRKYQDMIYEMNKSKKIENPELKNYEKDRNKGNIPERENFDNFREDNKKKFYRKNDYVIDEVIFKTFLKDNADKIEETKYETVIDHANYEEDLKELRQIREAIQSEKFNTVFYDIQDKKNDEINKEFQGLNIREDVKEKPVNIPSYFETNKIRDNFLSKHENNDNYKNEKFIYEKNLNNDYFLKNNNTLETENKNEKVIFENNDYFLENKQDLEEKNKNNDVFLERKNEFKGDKNNQTNFDLKKRNKNPFLRRSNDNRKYYEKKREDNETNVKNKKNISEDRDEIKIKKNNFDKNPDEEIEKTTINKKYESNEIKNDYNSKNEKINEDSTTSSLKNMIKKSEKLKEKFSDLEIQLEKIKKGNDTIPEKLQKQAKAFNKYYFPDAIDFKNDPDIL